VFHRHDTAENVAKEIEFDSVVHFIEYDDEQIKKDELVRSRNTLEADDKYIQIL
jgi:hypothetical protein